LQVTSCFCCPCTITFFAIAALAKSSSVPASNSAVRSIVSSQAKRKPAAAGTRAEVLFVRWPASNRTIVANQGCRRVATFLSYRRVGLDSSNPYLYRLLCDTVKPRPRIRSIRRRFGRRRHRHIQSSSPISLQTAYITRVS
jgi:hypothetical protein